MENKINIPTYRAQRIDNNKWVKGYLFKIWNEYFILWGTTNDNPNKIKIKQETLAISFPDMLDANGKQVFASLNKSGQGGDLIKSTSWKCKDEPQNLMIAVYNHFGFDLKFKLESDVSATPFNNIETEFEVIGLQK